MGEELKALSSNYLKESNGMNRTFSLIFLYVFWCGVCLAEPNVLKCKKHCGTPDISGEFSSPFPFFNYLRYILK